MLIRLFLALSFVPLAWGIHQSHLSLRKKVDFKASANQAVNLPPPQFLQLMTFGHDAFFADLLWLQLIQYYGAAQMEDITKEHLFRYFDTVTSLDPDFEMAYLLAGFLLTDDKKQVDLALKLMAKGEKNMPNSWQIPHQAGFLYYLQKKDTLKAAQAFERAGAIPGAPELPNMLAAQLYRRSNDIERCQLSLRMWDRAYQSSPTPELKKRAELHIVEARIQCDLITLRKALNDYVKISDQRYKEALEEAKLKRQRPPASPPPAVPSTLQELVRAGLINQVPLDPLDRPYIYRQQGLKVLVQPLPWKAVDLKPSDFVSPPK